MNLAIKSEYFLSFENAIKYISKDFQIKMKLKMTNLPHLSHVC